MRVNPIVQPRQTFIRVDPSVKMAITLDKTISVGKIKIFFTLNCLIIKIINTLSWQNEVNYTLSYIPPVCSSESRELSHELIAKFNGKQSDFYFQLGSV